MLSQILLVLQIHQHAGLSGKGEVLFPTAHCVNSVTSFEPAREHVTNEEQLYQVLSVTLWPATGTERP